MGTMDTVKANLGQFLSTLDLVDIFSLEKTTMNGVTASTNTSDAITNILHYSDPELILSRRVITKKILNKFLHSNRVPGYNPQANKAQLVQVLLRYIGHGSENPQLLRIPQTPGPDDPNSNTEVIKPGHLNNVSSPASNNAYPGPEPNNTSPTVTEENTEVVVIEEEMEEDEPEDLAAQDLALRFTNWFYAILNDPSVRDTQFTPDDIFLPQCQLHAMLVKPEGSLQKYDVEGNSETRDFYNRLVIPSGNAILFTPNISPDGIHGRRNSFGLLQVEVKGTFIAQNTVNGIFMNVFTLCPVTNPETQQFFYKILKSNLMLREILLPKLCDQDKPQLRSGDGNLAIGF